MRAAFALLGLFATNLVAEVASACDSPTLAVFEIRGDASDDTPPAAPTASVERIKRGKGPKQEGCSQQVSSCDGSGYLLVNVSAAPESDVGFVLEIKGRAPETFANYAGRPLEPHDFEPGKLRLPWEDGEGEKGYDFEIEIWSVDRAGNMSETSTRLRIDNDGSDGCNARSSDSHGGWLAALCALMFVRRYRHGTPPM
jgi:hypothetical protein